MSSELRTLIVGTKWLGNNVILHSLIQKLYQNNKRPIDYLLYSVNAELGQLMPEIDIVHVHDFASGKLELNKRIAIGKDLRKYDYKYAYLLPDHFKPALIPYFAKIPNIIGFKGEFRSFILSDAKTAPSYHSQHYIDRVTSLASLENEKIKSICPKLVVEESIFKKAVDKFNLSENERTICICPGGAKYKSGIWSSDNYCKLLQLLKPQNYNYIFVGSKNDTNFAKEVINSIDDINIKDLTGQTTLLEVAAIMKHSFATIANDSGLMHLAAGLSVTTLGIFTTREPEIWNPQGLRADYIGGNNNIPAVNDVYDKFIAMTTNR